MSINHLLIIEQQEMFRGRDSCEDSVFERAFEIRENQLKNEKV